MTNATLAKILLTGIVAIGGGGFLVYSSVGQAQHYMQVDQLVGGKEGPIDKWKETDLKVHGKVIAGSIVEQVIGPKMERTFLLETNGQKIRVFHSGPVPQTFKDESDVIALGQIIPAAQRQDLATSLCEKAKAKGGAAACPIKTDAEQAWVVDASELSAKCPSRYEGAPNNKLDTNYK